MSGASPPAEPAVPRPAASVLLVRETGAPDGLEVYMIRRNRGMKFLGGYYAFPGGKVDAADGDAATLVRAHGLTADEAAGSFSPVTLDGASAANGGIAPIAYWVTAARELLEETGVLLARDAAGRALDARDLDAIDACRRDVMDGAPFAGALARRDWRCDLRPLRYLSHFVTPPRSPIRFTARFFLCSLPAGQAPRLFTEETSEGFWIAPGEAYWRFVDDAMAMAEPAEYALAYLSQFASLDELWASHEDGRARFEGTSHRGASLAPDWKRWRFPNRA